MPEKTKKYGTITIGNPSTECNQVDQGLGIRVEGSYSGYDQIVVAICKTLADLNGVNPSNPSQVVDATLLPLAGTWHADPVTVAETGTRAECYAKDVKAENYLGIWKGELDPMGSIVMDPALFMYRKFYAYH